MWFMGQFLSPIILLPFLDSIKESKLFLVIAGILFGLSILTFGFYMISNKAKNI
jgi:hypothetical protein